MTAWPYEPTTAIELGLDTKPRWTCPGGNCVCHPGGIEPTKVEHFVFLHDDRSRRMPGALCRAHIPGVQPPDVLVADATGAVVLELPESVSGIFLEWGAATPVAGHPYRRTYRIDLGEDIETVERQLAHIGVSMAPSLTERVYDFQVAYGLAPFDGEPMSLAPWLREYHSAGRLPPLPPQTGNAAPPPLERDRRGPSQGAVSVVAPLHPHPARLKIQLVDPDEAPIANAAYRLHLAATYVEGATDGEGHLDYDGLPFGDHRIELDGATLFASASATDDPARRVLVVF